MLLPNAESSREYSPVAESEGEDLKSKVMRLSQSRYCIGCCIACSGCCCCVFLLILALVLWVLAGVPGGRSIPIGINSVAFGYAADMIHIPVVGSYAEAWCDGTVAGCQVKSNYPGPGTTSYMSWDEVWKMGAQTPEKEWSGEWWRGNELGYLIQSSMFWSHNGIDPPAIALGILPSQHAAIRPTIEEIYTLGPEGGHKYKKAHEASVRIIAAFFEERDTIAVPGDLTALFHQILYEVTFDRNISWEYAQNFVSVQGRIVAMGTVGHLVPAFLSGVVLGSLSEEVGKYVREYVPLVEEKYGAKLAEEDCSPSLNCTWQLASAIWDSLYAAGGLSVPGTVGPGLGTLYSTDASNPSQKKRYERSQALEFYWESIRFFAPVVGFPHWATRPDCVGSSEEATAALNESNGKTKSCPFLKNRWTGSKDVNEYMGGIREVPNMALAMRDPAKWGDDASKFGIRNISEYRQNSVAFAEMAVDDDVAGGRMNRICPGKTLALMLGETFFKLFDQSQWKTDDEITFTGLTPFVSAFALSRLPNQ